MEFSDRTDAGKQLASRLADLVRDEPVVVGLPRGGVPVAFEVARRLRAPLDVVVVRKLGVPSNPELAMGALGESGAIVVNEGVIRAAGVSDSDFAAVRQAEQRELDRRVGQLRHGRSRVPLAGRVVVLVDDGIATGATARAACQVVRAAGASRVVLAVPIAAPDTMQSLRSVADEVICLQAPAWFMAVGQGYRDFTPVTDEEVSRLLDRAGTWADIDLTTQVLEVAVETRAALLPGALVIPHGARMTVVFAHGSGSSRHSPRNAWVASVLNDAGLATLLFDLLTPEEERDRANVFDIPLLASRVSEATAWLRRGGQAPDRIGYFGASTGAAAALWAAGEAPSEISAVVSRGGRPDLALPRLAMVAAPTLLIVGSRDHEVLDLNRTALARLRHGQLAVVPGATHLFEEPGTLQAAAHLARDWFLAHPPSAKQDVEPGHGVAARH